VTAKPGSLVEVLTVFLKLGCRCFGGPIAHIGYFRDEFVVRRAWLDESTYADLVALCQFLPGPASSQVGFSIGLMRAGLCGGVAAWSGFTLPSAILMVLFAYGAGRLGGPVGISLMHGLALVAVAIVAGAVAGMARTLCPDRTRATIAVVAALIVLSGATLLAQLGAILWGVLAGWALCRSAGAAPDRHLPMPVSRRAGIAAFALFLLLLIGLPPLARFDPSLALFGAFYRSGALVFGGGHVVLPLLRQAVVVPGWVADDAFLAGYGAVQAVPGPLFTFAAYLGAIASAAPQRPAGAALGLVGIFLPGLLVVTGMLPFWDRVRQRAGVQTMMQGANAAVVGLLAAALYSPLWTGAVMTPTDFGVALVEFMLLTVWRASPLLVVALGASSGVLLL
jgi:chromate transporter